MGVKSTRRPAAARAVQDTSAGTVVRVGLHLLPLGLREANAVVLRWHRHHEPARGMKFAIGAAQTGQIVGAVIVGRPVGRGVDPVSTAEVTRLATDGTKNVCSFLYAAAARAAKAMGYQNIQTYILASEPGTSLRAAGWLREGMVRGRQWTTSVSGQLVIPETRRQRAVQGEAKARWRKDLTR